MAILIVGSVALDSIETPFGKTEGALGGSATYSSLSASFFAPVNLVAVVGRDFPPRHKALFAKRGVNTKGLETADGETFRWKGRYDCNFSGAATIYTRLNVFKNFSPKIPDEYKASRFLFLANIDPDLQLAVMKQVDNPKLTACDTMNYWIVNKKHSLMKAARQVDLFFLNESEARQLTGESNLLKAGRMICALGPKRVIIKKGEHGALLVSREAVFSAPAYLLESVNDPTGAGDAFAGGLMGYLAKNGRITDSEIKKGIIYGTIMASYAVEDFGVRTLSNLTFGDIQRRYRDYLRRTSALSN